MGEHNAAGATSTSTMGLGLTRAAHIQQVIVWDMGRSISPRGGGKEPHGLLLFVIKERLGEVVSRGRHELTDPVRVSVHGIFRSWEIEAEGFKWYRKTISFYFSPH